MSGKCVSIAAISLLLLGCLVGISVILFQEDTSEGSIGPQERSYRPNWDKSDDAQEYHPSRNANGAAAGKPLQFPPKNNSVNSRRKPIVSTTPPEAASSTAHTPSEISTVPISFPSTLAPPPVKVLPRIIAMQPDLEAQWSLPSMEVDPVLRRRGQLKADALEREPTQIRGEPPRPWGVPPMPTYDDSYDQTEEPDEGPEEFEEDGDTDWESSEFNELLDLASRLYTSNVNTTDFQGFLQTTHDKNGHFAENSVGIGRNAYESSLTAFAFMSFGVFLLKQIHSLLGKGTSDVVEGRHLATSLFSDTNLNVLFAPPPFSESSGQGDAESSSRHLGGQSQTPAEMNNMFRAMLNLVNAYTKDSQALECIWASYCEDLDKTSANEGLFGIAARINSIGLRLIMHQISAELTLDVLLRSLLGWDGLPCKKMFPLCEAGNATSILDAAAATNGNAHLSQRKLASLQE